MELYYENQTMGPNGVHGRKNVNCTVKGSVNCGMGPGPTKQSLDSCFRSACGA